MIWPWRRRDGAMRELELLRAFAHLRETELAARQAYETAGAASYRASLAVEAGDPAAFAKAYREAQDLDRQKRAAYARAGAAERRYRALLRRG